MNKNVIITISRQFGSNGREIGRQLAEYLDIGYYNKEIMEVIANDFGIDPDFFREENRNEQGLFSVAGRHKLSAITELSVNSEVYEKACDLIQGIISKRKCGNRRPLCGLYLKRSSQYDKAVYLFGFGDKNQLEHQRI